MAFRLSRLLDGCCLFGELLMFPLTERREYRSRRGAELAGGLHVVSFGETMRSHGLFLFYLFIYFAKAVEPWGPEPWIFNAQHDPFDSFRPCAMLFIIPTQVSLSVFPIVLLLCLFVAVIWLQLIVKLRFILIGRFSNCQYQFSVQGNRTFTNYHVV
jgi:hypothetical protein